MKTKIFILVLLFPFYSFSQKELGSFSATGSGVATAYLSDYQCLGINPANLGFSRSPGAIHLSFLEVGASVFSDALKKKELKDELIYGNKSNFTLEQKVTAAEAFTNNKLAINADVSWLSFSFLKSNFGGMAFSVREHAAFNSFFNKDFSEIIFRGFHAPYFDSTYVNGTDTTGFATVPKSLGQLADGSHISGAWYREYIIGYGRKLFANEKMALFVGADVKYIAGYGILDISAENNALKGFSALTPFMDVNYANATPSQIAGTAMKTVGSGFGFDLGATVTLFEKLNISAAINDIGSVKWDGNVYQAKDTIVNNVTNAGFYSYSMIEEMKGLIQDSSIFNWNGLESRSVSLPTNLRFGVNFKIKGNTSIGADIYIPVNNQTANYEKAIISAGGNLGIGKSLILSAGFGTGGNYDFVVPVGITFLLKSQRMEMGIASRDAITFFKKNNPTVSVAFGFLRFNLGKIAEEL